jgi:hypothetical protein
MAEHRHGVQAELCLLRAQLDIESAADLEQGSDLLEKFCIHGRAARPEETIINVVVHFV